MMQNQVKVEVTDIQSLPIKTVHTVLPKTDIHPISLIMIDELKC